MKKPEESIFAEALRKPSPRECSAFLDEACADNAELRREVEALLLAHEQAGEFLNSPPSALGVTNDRAASDAQTSSPSEQAGSLVGHYKLLEQIGEGGMGTVFMAEQLRPVRRRVALKIIKPGLDTNQVIARFEAERQALAMMDHPSIAKVFDAGATEAGRPYFVMELVKGIPITEYCDQHQLDPRQRLDLFIQVCQAVQHAHQKGIIHRDLKPTNVLVTLNDGKAVPKIIDFGIAKATAGQRLTERTLFTHFAQMIGTPLYMSPEQAEMSALMDVDTRSDVYGLGVLLYELLTGTTPFDKERLAKAAYEEVRRIFREEEPPKPSTRLSTMLGATLTAVSAQRHTDAKRLGQLVRGELDWIVMKALEKDRTRRYETANGLARDVERYLSDQPVEACPPSRVYRLRKFARRNKAALSTMAIIAAVLVLATVVSTWQAVRATRASAAAMAEKRRADEQSVIAQSNAARADREADHSRQEAEKLDKINAYLYDTLKTIDPNLPAQMLAKDVLNQLLQQETRLAKDEKRLSEALAAAERQYGPRHLSVLVAMGDLFGTLRHQRRLKEAEPYGWKLLELTKAVRGPKHPEVKERLNDLRGVLVNLKKPKEAIQVAREAVQFAKDVHGQNHLEVVEQLKGVCGLLRDQHDWMGCEQVAMELVEQAKQLYGSKDSIVADYLDDVIEFRQQQEKHAAAEEAALQALAIRRDRFGEESAEVQLSLRTLGRLLTDQGKTSEAIAAAQQVLTIQRKLGPDTRELAEDASQLAGELQDAGNFSEAEALLREALAIQQKLHGQESGEEGGVRLSLSTMLRAQGKTAEFEALWRERLEYWQRQLATADTTERRAHIHLRMFWSLMNIGQVEQAKASCRKALELDPTDAAAVDLLIGHASALATSTDPAHRDPALAEALFRRALAVKRSHDDPDVVQIVYGLAQVLQSQDRRSEAETLYGEAVGELRKKGDSASLAATISLFGAMLQSEGKFVEAEAQYREELTIRRNLFGEDSDEVRRNLDRLTDLLRAEGKSAEAEALWREAVATQRKLGGDSAGLTSAILFFAAELKATGNFSESEELYREALAIRGKSFAKDSDAVRWCMDRLTDVLSAQGKTADIEALWRERLEEWQKELESADTSPQRRAELYFSRFQPLMYCGQVEQAKASCRKALELNPRGDAAASALNSIAWSLATSADLAQRDSALAVELGEKAVELDPTSSYNRGTLGTARYRAGDYQRAVEDLRKSLQLNEGGHAADFFFRAMAHHRLGDPKTAKEWYEKGVEWMQRQAPEDEELQRFRAEAQETLLLKATTTQPTSQPAATTPAAVTSPQR